MLEQELKQIWRNSSKASQIKYDVSLLNKDFKMNLTTAEKRVINRDRREIIVAILTMILFAYFVYEVPFFWSKVTSVLCVMSFGFLIYKLRANRKLKQLPDPSSTYADQLGKDEAFMKRQSQLLNTVLYWYVIPLLGTQALFFWSIGNPADVGWSGFWSDILPSSLTQKILVSVFFVAMGAYIVWLNKEAVRLTWKPLIQQIQQIRANLNSDE